MIRLSIAGQFAPSREMSFTLKCSQGVHLPVPFGSQPPPSKVGHWRNGGGQEPLDPLASE